MIDHFDGEYAFLSNFYPWDAQLRRYVAEAPVLMYGQTYRTVEHAFQAAKTANKGERLLIRLASTPGQAKRLGRKVKLRPDWNEVRVNVMFTLVFRKFTEHKFLGDLLLATGDHELIEGNNWNDTFWGVCRGKGENQLGQILMRVRSELAEN